MESPAKSENVAIIGASEKPGRYAKLAQELLIEKGHKVIPISPRAGRIGGIDSYQKIQDIPDDIKIDTVTVYVRPENFEEYVRPIIEKGAKRVIFNPGTESMILEAEFKAAGIQAEEACTLILLRTEQF